MKAAIQTAYGDASVLHLESVEKPVPADDEILVRIMASSATAADSMMRRGTPRFARLFLGLFKPRIRISGTGFSGVVETAGKNVSTFRCGEAVFGENVLGAGTNTEFVCIKADGAVVHKPDSITHAEAAPVCDGAMTVMYMLNNLGHLKKGQRVLVNGAAGSLGSAAVQLAYHKGAHVTAVCSRGNFQFVRSLGADCVIDYNESDITTKSSRYDLIFDSVGKLNFQSCKKILNSAGVFLSPALSLPLLFYVLLSKFTAGDSRKARFSATGLLPAAQRRLMLQELSSQLEAGTLKTIVSRRYPLSDIVSAHQHLDTGHKRANIVIMTES